MQVLSSFHCAKTIESLLFTSMRSNLYSGGIHARRPIIHTCCQQKNTCNLDFLLSHIRIYTPSEQLHHIQKEMNRSWCPFSCVVQGVLKSHRKGGNNFIPFILRAWKIVCHNHAFSIYFLSKATRRSIYSNSATPTWTPFLSIFWPVIAGKVSYRCTPHDLHNSDVPFYFLIVLFITKH